MDSEKTEFLAESLEAQCQLITILSVLAFIEMFGVALRSYFPTPASKSKLNNPDKVHEAIWGLKVGRAPGPDCIPNRA